MKTLLKATILMAILAFFSTAAFSQTRIKFKRGATSAVVSGSLRSYKSHRTYVIRVRAGQTLSTKSVGSHYITIDITAPPGSTYEPDLAADCHDRHEVTPTAAGDYTIRVTECLKADPWRGRFKLRVKVR